MHPPIRFFSPMVQPQRKWADRRRRGDVPAIPGKHLVVCQRCGVRVGRTYVQREVYLWPISARGGLSWQSVCGTCATEDLGLAFGFCLVSAADWGQEDLLSSFALVRKAKVAELEAEFLPLLQAWRTARTDARSTQSETLLRLARVAPPKVLTYRSLYAELERDVCQSA